MHERLEKVDRGLVNGSKEFKVCEILYWKLTLLDSVVERAFWERIGLRRGKDCPGPWKLTNPIMPNFPATGLFYSNPLVNSGLKCSSNERVKNSEHNLLCGERKGSW